MKPLSQMPDKAVILEIYENGTIPYVLVFPDDMGDPEQYALPLPLAHFLRAGWMGSKVTKEKHRKIFQTEIQSALTVLQELIGKGQAND